MHLTTRKGEATATAELIRAILSLHIFRGRGSETWCVLLWTLPILFIFRIALSISISGSWKKSKSLLLARYTHGSLSPSFTYLARKYTVTSFPKMIPAGFLTITACSRLGDKASESYRTIRLLQLRGRLKLLLPYTRYHFDPGCTFLQLSIILWAWQDQVRDTLTERFWYRAYTH